MIRAAAPRSTLASLALVPTDRRVSLLVRHSHRPGIPSGEVGYDVGLSTRVEGPAARDGPHVAIRYLVVASSPRSMRRGSRQPGQGSALEVGGRGGLMAVQTVLDWRDLA